MHFETKLTIDPSYLTATNLVPRLSGDDRTHLGHMVVEGFERDRESRTDWEKRNDNALKLALQITTHKTFPWEGAANVKFPLVTIAAVQYQSRAYPALVNGPHPIAAAPIAQRPNPRIPPGLQQAAQQDPGAKQFLQSLIQQATKQLFEYQSLEDRATRISHHMSYQILDEDETWEENHDRSLLIQCIMGCVFKKSYFDPIKRHNISECVSPKDLYVSYYTKSIETAPRVTHVIYLSANEIYERECRGTFAEMDSTGPVPPQPKLTFGSQRVANERQGTTQVASDPAAPFELLEQQVNIDFDQDGYAEPYLVTVRYDTKQVLRIVPRFTRTDITYNSKGAILRIDPIQAFTKYPFIPSPDGGFYDLGFGQLLSPLNETIDSALNQMLDLGTLINAGGGFVGRGFRNKHGEYRFRPGEWKTVESTGDDIRKNVLPLPLPTPNTVLFQLLQLLIDYSERIAGATDILQGKNPGQNTPAETSRTMVEQGMKVFNGIYKRTHRAQTQEFRKLFRLNTIYLSDMAYFARAGKDVQKQMMADYDFSGGLIIRCSADPFYMSDAQRLNQATAMREASMTSPGYNRYEVEKYYLQALKVPQIDKFYPDPTGPYAVPPPQNPKVQIEQLKVQSKEKLAGQEMQLKVAELQQSAEKLAAEVKKLEADAALAMSQAQGIDVGHQIALLEAQIGAKKAHMEGLTNAIKLLHEVSQGGTSSAGVAPPSSQQGPASPAAPMAAGLATGLGGGALPK